MAKRRSHGRTNSRQLTASALPTTQKRRSNERRFWYLVLCTQASRYGCLKYAASGVPKVTIWLVRITSPCPERWMILVATSFFSNSL